MLNGVHVDIIFYYWIYHWATQNEWLNIATFGPKVGRTPGPYIGKRYL